jgi:type I restriction enzyme M protein
MVFMSAVRFANEYELQRVVQRCHDVLWEREGLDPAQAFDEFSKVLFIKLYDESNGNVLNPATIHRHETPAEFARRIRSLFTEAYEHPGFAGIFQGPTPQLQGDDLTLYEVFRHLQPYSLLATTAAVDGADIKGTVYEHIVGHTFRGELGQFFTHRSIVEFMVRLVGIDEHQVVYDPSCGSGGFLIMCAKLLREQLLADEPDLSPDELAQRLHDYSCDLLGTEINERTARVAKLNLLMHGLDYRGIFNVNALKVEIDGTPEMRARLAEGTLDVIFANPPFAGYEKDPAVLSQFELGRNGHGQVASVTREVLFLERILRLLREGGVAGIVIPQGIFSNRNLQRVRDYLRAHAQILAVLELPDWAFIPSGTSVRGSLLFLRKASPPPDDYLVFMKRLEHIGFTSTSRPSEENEFPATLEEYRRGDPRYLVPIGELSGRLDARFYVPDNRAVLRLFQENPRHRLVALQDLGSFYTDKRNPRQTPEAFIDLIETSSVDPETLTITPKRIRGADSNYTSLKVVRTGDVLISRRRAYRGAIVEIPPELDGALAIPEFSVFRLRPEFDRAYILEVLRSQPFLDLMTIYSTGEMSGRIAEKDLRHLKIPLPDHHAEIGREFTALRTRIAEWEQRIQEERATIAAKVQGILNGA